ncbi:MAG: FumA C-terminus/TtdB family hydratase beta subunit [Bacillota bacterium]
MSKVVNLTFPITEKQVQELEVGDIVYLSGLVHTMRDMGHARALEILRRGEKLPFDLANSCIWHAAPVVRQDESGKWHIVSIGSTTSSRFTPLGSEILELLGMKCTLGKGTMHKQAMDVMEKIGSVYLCTTGGCAALYAQQIEEVEDVYWLDLGLPEAIWAMRVKNLGPLVVGIDAHNNSLYLNMRKNMNARLQEQLGKSGISLSKSFTYLPVSIVGKSRTK